MIEITDNEIIKALEDATNPLKDISPKFVEMYMGIIKNLTHQPKKIEHNSLCETETYESR